ncbi:MAG: DUF3794 domain-containing protein [Clostridia bacterium]|nr:DUF3794 domain-containing protein [Clostridia bacterium]
MDISFNEISVCDITKQHSTKAEVEADIIVPDTKPDIYRVLAVNALADVSEQSIKKDKMTFSGNVKFNILFSGEDDLSKVHSIDFTVPFNHQSDFAGIDESCSFVCTSKVRETSFDIKNSRKISAKASVGFEVHANKSVSENIINKSKELESYPFKSAEYECDCPIAFKNVFFETSETFTIPCKDEDAKILATSLKLDMSDIKAVNGKAVLKGQANIKMLCDYDDEISDYSTEISFTEVCDIENLAPENKMLSHFEVCKTDFDTSFSDMGMTVELTFGVRGYIIACNHVSFEAVTDIYSPDYVYEKESIEICTTSMSEIRHNQDTIKDSVEIPSLTDGISKIYHMESQISENAPEVNEASIKLTGNIHSVIIYSDENDSLCRVFKTTPYEFQIPHTFGSGEHFVISNVSCVNSGYLMGSANDIQIRVVLNAETAVLSSEKQSVVKSFNPDTKSPLQKDNQPSIIVIYPDSSSDIWEIAKKHNTTCEEIASVNSLDLSKPLPLGKAILIPKRQI